MKSSMTWGVFVHNKWELELIKYVRFCLDNRAYASLALVFEYNILLLLLLCLCELLIVRRNDLRLQLFGMSI